VGDGPAADADPRTVARGRKPGCREDRPLTESTTRPIPEARDRAIRRPFGLISAPLVLWRCGVNPRGREPFLPLFPGPVSGRIDGLDDRVPQKSPSGTGLDIKDSMR
jgi:hypothetical protein